MLKFLRTRWYKSPDTARGLFTQRTVTDILALSEDVFLTRMKAIILDYEPNAHIMMVFAWTMMRIELELNEKTLIENPNAGVPKGLDGFIMTAAKIADEAKSEIVLRRCHWFAHAGLLKRATDVAVRSGRLEDAGEMWVKIAESGWLIKNVYEHNIIWGEQEKSSFLLVHKGLDDGTSCILNFIMPKEIRRSKTVRAFVLSKGIFLPF